MKYFLLLPVALLILTACTSQEDRIKEQIEQAKYCSQDSDCVLVESVCPFGCYQAVNSNDSARVQALIQGYEPGNVKCVYGCVAANKTACVDRRCEVILEK